MNNNNVIQSRTEAERQNADMWLYAFTHPEEGMGSYTVTYYVLAVSLIWWMSGLGYPEPGQSALHREPSDDLDDDFYYEDPSDDPIEVDYDYIHAQWD